MTTDMLDRLPCAVIVTDTQGRVLACNAELIAMAGGSESGWVGDSIERLLPPASRIFMQTHVWPLILRDGLISELHLQIIDSQQQRVPVLLNGRLGDHHGGSACYWTFFVAKERHRFEAELVGARNRAQADLVEV
jgi:PAS domain-containing protein